MATESGRKAQAALLPTACANSSRIHRPVTNAVPDFMSELSSFDFEPERSKCEDEDIIISGSFGRKGNASGSSGGFRGSRAREPWNERAIGSLAKDGW